jgi:hypothetical protein
MALTITSGYLASDGEVWTPTKQNNSTVPKITLAQNEYMGRISAGVGPVEAVTVAQLKASLTIVPADITLAANSIFGNNTGGLAPGTALTPAQVKTLLTIAQEDIADLLTTSSVLFAAVTAQQNVAGPVSVFDARNVSASAAATTKFNIGNDVSGALFEIQVYSSTHANASKAFIYTTGPSDLALGVNGAQNLIFAGATGVATFNAQVNAPVFNSTSARRYKKHIARLAPDADKLLALRPVSYDWKDNKSQPFQMGFIAEEVDALFPSLVQRADGEVQGLNYNGLLAVAFAAAQDHEYRLRKLEGKSR